MVPVSVLFVCMGNICRSPMAEGIFLSIIEREGVGDEFLIDSAGTLGYHQGELPDRRMRFHAERRGYCLTSLSRKFRRHDFDKFDLIIAMDDNNYEDLKDQALTKNEVNKIHRMVEYSKEFKETHIPDPYYGGSDGFDHVIDLLEDACEGLFASLKNDKIS